MNTNLFNVEFWNVVCKDVDIYITE